MYRRGSNYEVFIYVLPVVFKHVRRTAKSAIRLSCLYLRQSAWNSSAATIRIFMKFGIGLFFENLSKKFARITGTLHEDQYTFF